MNDKTVHDPDDFNNLGVWLRQKLADRKISILAFSSQIEGKPTNGLLHAWMKDRHRPSVDMMDRICKALSKLPVILEDGSERIETVQLKEGLEQYSIRKQGAAAYRRKYRP